jgi:P4 family phage/plasmid primase-like protien
VYGGAAVRIPRRQDEINAFVNEFWANGKPGSNGHHPPPQSSGLDKSDEEVVAKARAQRGGKFDRLWRGDLSAVGGDHSRGDDSFIHKLYSYTQDEEQIKHIHAASGLHRPEKSGQRSDYLQRSIDRAKENVTWFYEWPDGSKVNTGNPDKKRPKPEQQKVKPAGDEAPTHDELRDRWLVGNPDHAFGLEEWRRYEGGIWPAIKAPLVKRAMMRTLEEAKEEGIKPNAFVLNSVHELCRIESYVEDVRWDSNPDILVAENGAVQISTGELLAHNPEHYATTRVPYAYDPHAEPKRWEYFLTTTLEDDVADFLQEFAGYCLTTDTSHEKAVWLVGQPGGGKSTFLEGLSATLGVRAGVLGLAEIEKSRFALAKLEGKTLVTAAEQPGGFVSCHHILNAIISGEPVQIERKFKDPYDLTPRAKIAWAMNELPRIPAGAEGLFRRVEVIRFPEIPEKEREPTLKEDVRGEGQGVLNWALEGLRRLRKRGRFDVPAVIKDATAQFRENNDIPALFVEERCVTGEGRSVKASELYSGYKMWCEQTNHKPKSSTTIAEDWRRLGFEKVKKKTGNFWSGVDLLEHDRWR